MSDTGFFSISLTEPLVPTFGTYTRTADGFTVQISNYDSNFTWAGTATAGGSVSISGTGLATISGVAPGTNSVATITTTRVSFDAGSAATASTQSLLAQTVTWSPTTSALVQQSPLTPSTSASALGGATISYSVTSAGITSCTVNSSSGVLTYNAPGVCVVRASAAATSNYASATRDVTFNITSISVQPSSDTTTAGLTNTFSLTTVSAPSPLTRTIKWQVASDTTTAVASVAWADVTSGNGSGFTTETFTTSTLTTAMNKYRYRAIVTFTGSGATAGITSIETTTVATLTINPAITFTSLQTAISNKYGAAGTTRTVAFTGGTDTRTITASSLSLADGKITFNTSTALLSVDTRTAVGTYYDTFTVTDAKGATASYVQTITFTVADTLTVTSDTPTAFTYTGSAANFTPTVSSVSGLITGDVISRATYTYSSNSIPTCAQGGSCSIGQIGPAGGIVFYVSGTAINSSAGISSGGTYLEAAPAPVSKTTYNWCEGGANPYTTTIGASGTAVGTGASNTAIIIANCTGGAGYSAANLTLGSYSDWFLPSSGELALMYGQMSAIGLTGTEATYLYWGSTESSNWIGASLVPWAGVGGQNKGQATPYWPIRAFSQTISTLVSYAPSTTIPTNASTYTITPSVLTFSSGAASNYVAITYRTSTLTINKAAQAALSVVPLYQPFNSNPTTATLLTTGGTDTGTVTYAYVSSLSTAGGCTLSGSDSSTVSVTSDGTCRIVATKAATDNYLAAVSDTGTVTFHLYISGLPAARPQATPNEIVLVGATPITYGDVPAIISSGTPTTQAVGSTITLTGSGFTGTTSVKIKGYVASFVINSDTSLTLTVPVGLAGKSGRIVVENAAGTSISDTLFLFT